MKQFLALIIFMNFLFCIQAQDTSAWTEQTGENYIIQYPDYWIFESPGRFGTVFQVYAPKEDTSDTFWENVSLMIQDLSATEIDLDQYVEISEKQVKTMVTDSELLKSSRNTSDSLEYHELEYSGRQGINTLLTIQRFFILNNKAYILTGVVEFEKKDMYYNTIYKIFDNFELQ